MIYNYIKIFLHGKPRRYKRKYVKHLMSITLRKLEIYQNSENTYFDGYEENLGECMNFLEEYLKAL